MVLTNHAYKRAKVRLGQNKKIAERNAKWAFKHGIKHCEVKSKELKLFLNSLYLSQGKANNLRIFRKGVYCFRNNVLITVVDLPPGFWKEIEGFQEGRSLKVC